MLSFATVGRLIGDVWERVFLSGPELARAARGFRGPGIKTTTRVAEAAGNIFGKIGPEVNLLRKKAAFELPLRAKETLKFLRTDSAARNLVFAGAGATVGWMTSDKNSSPLQRAGHIAAFAGLGTYGLRVATKHPRAWGAFAGKVKEGEWKLAARNLGNAFEMPKKWTIKHSMMAGGLYGLLSQHTTVAEGVMFGGIAHFATGGIKNLYKDRGEEFKELRKAKEYKQIFSRAPFIRTAMYGGMALGAYHNLGVGNPTGMNVLGGAAKGAGIAGAIGIPARIGIKHPVIGMGIEIPIASLGIQTAGAAAQVMGSGAPEFDTLNSDGELALALHRLRHG
jgi:hypothetical protein